jgi:outer membrane protein TolC
VRTPLAAALLVVGFVALSFGAPPKGRARGPAKPASVPAPAIALLEAIHVDSDGGKASVVIQSDQPLKFREVVQESPSGLTLYLLTPTKSRLPALQPVAAGPVEEVRCVYQDGRSPVKEPVAVDSIFLKLRHPARHKIHQKDWVLKVEFEARTPAKAAGARPAPAGPSSLAAPATRRKGKGLLPLPPEPTLQDFLNVGFANHVPLRLAEEEHRLAKFRLFEASRALFPSVTGRYVESEGTLELNPSTTTDDTPFHRREVGVQLGQPLFQSGRLFYSVRQAAMQKRRAEQNLARVRNDLTFEIKRAYHNLVKAQRALRARQELFAEAAKILELTRKKKQLEVIAEAEALAVESLYSQAHYRMLSDEKDLAIARLRLAALLNIPDALPAVIPEPPAPADPRNAPRIEADVETLLLQAQSHRPELLAAGYSARFYEYGAKAAAAEGRLRVDASGFVGQSGGEFLDRSIEMRHSWNIGVQARTSFWGSGLRGTRTEEKTSPDLGETSRTETRAESAEVGFLDSLKTISDRRQARLERDRARMEHEEARRQTEVDVREAFFNVEKAQLQLKGARQELDYRQKDAIVSRQKERLNLLDPSQRFASESAFAEARAAYEEAVAFHKVSLASLEKAVGLPLESLVRER